MARSDDPLDEKIRRLRDSVDWEEDSQVQIILNQAPPAPRSVPASAKGLVAVLAQVPPAHRVVVVLAVIAAATYAGKALGWF